MNHNRERMPVCVSVSLSEGRCQGKAFHSFTFDMDAHRTDSDRNIGVIYAADILLIIPMSLHPIGLQDMKQLPFCPVSFALAVHGSFCVLQIVEQALSLNLGKGQGAPIVL